MTSLKSVIKNAARTAFSAIGDIKEQVAVDIYASSSYNVSTGVASAYSERALTSMVFTRYKVSQIDGERIQPNDVMGLCTHDDLPITPNVDDQVTRIENYVSTVYDVISVQEDPARATWKLQLRKR